MDRCLVSVLFLAIAFSGCRSADNENEVVVRFGEGRTATVFLQEESTDDQRVLVVDYKSESPRLRESEVDEDIRLIWESVRPLADKRGFTEALIKYRQPDPETEDRSLYLGLLFEAEKTENGSWKLRKVN